MGDRDGVIAQGGRPEQEAGVGERGGGRLGRSGLPSRDAEILEEAFVQAPLDGDGARRVPVEHDERAHVRGADPARLRARA